MNIRSVILGPTSIDIVVSDGRPLSITYAAIKARYDAASGGVAARKSAVATWAKDQWEARFGAATFNKSWVTAADFDPATGRVTVFTMALSEG